MKRKFAALLLSAVMACSILAGCSDSGSGSVPSGPSSKPSNGTSTTEPSDGNNNNNNGGTTTPGGSDNGSSDSSKITELHFDSFTYRIQEHDSASSYTVYYCFTVTNLNKFKDFNNAHVNFTVKDAQGKTISTGRAGFIPAVAAGDTVTFGGSFDITDSVPATVTYTPDYHVCTISDHDESKYANQSDLKVSSIVRKDDSDVHYVGTVTNNSKATVGGIYVTVFYRKDGKLYSGSKYSNTITNLSAGASASFDIYETAELAGCEYVVIASQMW